MTESYVMVTPDGKFFQNTKGVYKRSQPILRTSIACALKEVGFDYTKFVRRGGRYALK